jgi:RNA polymerase sigma factor (TIGR02999 family)
VGRLLPIIYEELHALAQAYMRQERPDHTLQPTALLNEAYVRLVGQPASNLKDHTHFLAVAARTMRQVLVDHARRHRCNKRGGDRQRSPLEEVVLMTENRAVDVLALDDALSELATVNPDHVRVVELRFFAGLTIDETARALGMSTATVERAWQSARAWLYRQLTKGDTQHGGGHAHVE